MAGRLLGEPVKLAWRRFALEAFQGRLESPRVDLGARTLGGLRVDALRLQCDRVVVAAGLPPRLVVQGPRVRISIAQSGVDAWARQRKLPFEIQLTGDGLLVRTGRTRMPRSEVHTELEISRGWFVIRPRRAAFLGLPATPVAPFPIYLPLPSLSGSFALRTVEHASSGLHAHLDVDDFEEPLSPGLSDRLRTRLLTP